MIKGKGYSLWFMPTGSVYDRLVKIISQLSKKYSSPNFEPHVTLLAPIDEPGEEITSKTSQLVSLIQPYEIKLTTVDYLDEYFRCLFIRAEETKDDIGSNLYIAINSNAKNRVDGLFSFGTEIIMDENRRIIRKVNKKQNKEM